MNQSNSGARSISTLAAHEPTTKKSRRKVMGFKDALLLLLIVILLAVLGVVYWQYTQLANKQSSAESAEIIDAVRKLVSIDENENLSIAKVDDPDTLKKQNSEFYKDVERGNYLVVLTKSQRVIIYDKEENRIVNFSSYNIIPEVIDEKDIAASEKPLKIEIRKSPSVAATAVDSVKDSLKKLSTNYTVVGESSTSNDNYAGVTLVLLNTKDKPKMSKNLANQVAAAPGEKSIVEKLPDGEAASTADILLILGKAE